jgi:DNA-binding transcriptional MerR regulator
MTDKDAERVEEIRKLHEAGYPYADGVGFLLSLYDDLNASLEAVRALPEKWEAQIKVWADELDAAVAEQRNNTLKHSEHHGMYWLEKTAEEVRQALLAGRTEGE